MNEQKIMETKTAPNRSVPMKNAFPVTGMTCAGCASSVESVLRQTDGVLQARVNLASHEVWVEYAPEVTENDLQTALQAVGYDLIIDVEDPIAAQEATQLAHYKQVKRDTLWAGVFTFPVLIIGMFYMDWVAGKWISLALSLPVLFWFGRRFLCQCLQTGKAWKGQYGYPGSLEYWYCLYL